VVNQQNNLVAFSLAVLLGVAMTGFASDDVTTEEAIETSPWSGLISLTAGQRPEFYDEDGRFSQLDARITYRVKAGHQLSLLQGVRTVSQVSPPNRDGTWATDTLVRYNMPTLYERTDLGLRVLGRLQATVLPNTRTSRRDTLKGAIAGRVSTQLKVAKATLSYGLDVSWREYAHTFNPDGRPNYHTQLMQLLATSYRATSKLTLIPFYNYLHRRYHDGTQRDLYWLGFEAGYQVSQPMTLSLGFDTSDSQLKSGRRAPVYIYKEDLSEVYFRVDYSI